MSSLLLLLLLAAVAVAVSAYPSFIIFVVVSDGPPRDDTWKWMRGTSIRTDGTYHRPQLPPNHPYLYDQPIVIDTDDEVEMHGKINEWIVRECGRRGNRPIHVDTKCFVHTTTYPLTYTYPRPPDAELFRTRSVLTNIANRLEQPHCHERPIDACMDDKKCAIFGIYGCQLRTFCGFTSRHACEATGRCVYRLGICTSK